MYARELYNVELYNPEIFYHDDENEFADSPPVYTPLVDTPIGSASNSQIIETPAFSDFLKNQEVTNLFTILVGVGTVVSLLPLFLSFVLGSDWIQMLFSTLYGYLTFVLILTSVILSLIFMTFILGYIGIEFYENVIQRNYSSANKFMASVLLVSFLVSFLSLFVVLLSVWVIRATIHIDLIQSITLAFVALIFGLIFMICGMFVFISSTPQNLQNRSFSEDLERFIAIIRRNCCRILAGFILICILAILVWLIFSPPAFLILNYYGNSTKIIEINLSYENESVANITPMVLHLRQTATKAENIGVDLSYFDCRWSTNYGHFIEINSNNTEFINHQQDVFSSGLPKCPLVEDNVYWTYDISDFGKDKPDVIIGFTIKDGNKGNLLGSNYLKFKWKDKDTLVFVNKTNQG